LQKGVNVLNKVIGGTKIVPWRGDNYSGEEREVALESREESYFEVNKRIVANAIIQVWVRSVHVFNSTWSLFRVIRSTNGLSESPLERNRWKFKLKNRNRCVIFKIIMYAGQWRR
jgi:hypothetical protein